MIPKNSMKIHNEKISCIVKGCFRVPQAAVMQSVAKCHKISQNFSPFPDSILLSARSCRTSELREIRPAFGLRGNYKPKSQIHWLPKKPDKICSKNNVIKYVYMYCMLNYSSLQYTSFFQFQVILFCRRLGVAFLPINVGQP